GDRRPRPGGADRAVRGIDGCPRGEPGDGVRLAEAVRRPGTPTPPAEGTEAETSRLPGGADRASGGAGSRAPAEVAAERVDPGAVGAPRDGPGCRGRGEAPADDTTRLVLGDFLEENGEPDLGRFVRAGVTAAWFRTRGPERHERAVFDAALAEV